MRMIASSRMAGLALLLALGWLAVSEEDASAAATEALLSAAGPTFTNVAPTRDRNNPQGAWTVIAYGDMRFTNPQITSVTNPQARRALVARIAEERPDALLLSGDVPYAGGVASDYAVFHEETAAWRAAGLKVYPAIGNHELHGPNGVENWWKEFPELRGRRWYSVAFGEAYFITLDSTLDLRGGSVQSLWLAKQLAELPKGTKYIFISLHHPPVADPIAGDASHNVRPNSPWCK